jgi:Uma2 family endonuclease
MNAPLDLRLPKQEFDRWVSRQRERFEWKDGRVVQMNNVTRGHAYIVSDIAFALRQRLGAGWRVVTGDFGVEGADFVRYPDVLVEPANDDNKQRRSSQPTVIFEVLSPSTVRTDIIEKREEYDSLPSVATYVVLSQDEPIVWVWVRSADTARLPMKPEELAGGDSVLALPVLGVTLPLAEIYQSLGPR